MNIRILYYSFYSMQIHLNSTCMFVSQIYPPVLFHCNTVWLPELWGTRTFHPCGQLNMLLTCSLLVDSFQRLCGWHTDWATGNCLFQLVLPTFCIVRTLMNFQGKSEFRINTSCFVTEQYLHGLNNIPFVSKIKICILRFLAAVTSNMLQLATLC